MKISQKHFDRLQGNPNKLENIKDAITNFIEHKIEEEKQNKGKI